MKDQNNKKNIPLGDNAQEKKSVKIFCSYSHKDMKYQEELKKFLANLIADGTIEYSCDKDIILGSNLKEGIREKINYCSVMIFLVSQNFLNSPECRNELMQATTKKKKIIPVILSDCDWQGCEEISRVKALLKNGKPIENCENQKSAWEGIVNEIRFYVTKSAEESFNLQPNFEKWLINSPIQWSHPERNALSLEDIFIYPDLDYVIEKSKDAPVICENLKKIQFKPGNKFLIKGENQSGKTSILKKIFLDQKKEGRISIYIEGKNLNKSGAKKIIEKAYKKIYAVYNDFSSYMHLEREKRVLLIDDLDAHDSKINIEKCLAGLEEFFSIIVIMKSKEYKSVSSALNKKFLYYTAFEITELSRENIFEMVSKWNRLNNKPERDVRKEELLMEKIDGIVTSQRIIPRYPVLILTIMQSADMSISKNYEMTSYGSCYELLITGLLAKMRFIKQGQSSYSIDSPKMDGEMHDYIDSYKTFLTEFSFFIFQKKCKSITRDEFDAFFQLYKDKFYFQFSSNSVIKELNSVGIIDTIEQSGIKFRHRYIYYFFIAKHLSDSLQKDKPKAKGHIKGLSASIQIAESGNILLFLAHHSRDPFVLRHLMALAGSLYENYPLEKLDSDSLDFLDNKGRVNLEIRENNNPSLNRKNALRKQDEREREKERKRKNSVIGEDYAEPNKALRVMEILGQIIKNRSRSLESTHLKEIYKSGTDLSLRYLSFIIIEFKNLKEHLKNENENESDNDFKFDQILKGSIFGFLDITARYLGTEKLDIPFFDPKKDNVTSEALLSLFIRIRYYDFPVSSIIEMYKRTNSPIIKDYIRIAACRYLLFYNLKFDEKQRICSILRINIQKIGSNSKKKITQ